MAITSSPRSNSARQRCEPRNPAAPVTTARRPIVLSSTAADAVVGEAAPANGCRIEQVSGVDQAAGRHETADLVEVQPAELVPLCEHDEYGRSLTRGVGVGRHLDAVHGTGDGGVVGPEASAPLAEPAQHFDGGRTPEVVGAGL